MPSRFIVGRAPGCELRLSDPRVSGEHAAIYFEEGHWRLRDLASSNGTRLNADPIQPGARHALLRGDKLTFGSSSETWELIDEQAPPEEGIRETTPVAVTMAHVGLEFYVGPGPADLDVVLVTPRDKHSLPQRACHHLLLALARAREVDLSRGLPDKDCGWVHAEELTPDPFHDVVTVTLNIHRARKQLEGFGVEGAHGLIQRRKGRRIRLGVRAIKIDVAPGSTWGPPPPRSAPPSRPPSTPPHSTPLHSTPPPSAQPPHSTQPPSADAPHSTQPPSAPPPIAPPPSTPPHGTQPPIAQPPSTPPEES